MSPKKNDSADGESPEAPPKITLALADAELRRRMVELLDKQNVEVRTVLPHDDLWDQLEAESADVVLVRRSLLPDGGEELVASLDDDETPGVIVLSDDADPTDHVELLAAGASGVVAAESTQEVAEAVARLASAEAEGGIDGPDLRGSDPEPRLEDFLSRNSRMQSFVELVRRVVDSDTSILITGETGVGKERLARAIHGESSRAKGPFVSVNCGALPEQLLESELFGHETGAFTGANRARKGRFELASGGTIFLDEIGEMPIHLQVRLLTVLQRYEVHPVGADAPRRIDVRVVAATNRDPLKEIEEGRLREDLYYRLNVVSLEIPPLRDRPEDLPDLVGRFINHFRLERRPDVVGIEEKALDPLLAYGWPGNVRELINVVERAMLVTAGPRIQPQDLPEEIEPRPGSGSARSTGDGSGSESATTAAGGVLDPSWPELPLKEVRNEAVARVERAYLHELLTRHGGNVGDTAEAAGITPRALYDKMKKHGLRKEEYYADDA